MSKQNLQPYSAFGEDEAELSQREAKKVFNAIGAMVLSNYPTLTLSLFNSLTRAHGIPFPLVECLYEQWIKNQLAAKPPRIKQIQSIDQEEALYQII